MKVLIISFSVNGSMGDNFKMISRELSKCCEISVLTNQGVSCDDVGTLDVCKIEFNRRHPFDFINPYSYYKIYKYVKKVNYDVAFICSPHPVNLFIFHIVDNKRLVTFVHDHIQHSGVRRVDAFFTNWQLKYFYERSAKIIVSCHFIKKDIIKHHLMEDASKIEVNYLGLLDNLSFDRESLSEDIDVLFFGRIEFYKGLDILVETATQLPNYKFIIAGKGDLGNTFGIEILPSNIVHLNRYIPDKELSTFIQRSKLVVLPYRDATGTQTVQSIYDYSKPVIATSVGCFPEYVNDGIDGIIIPPCDVDALKKAIVSLMSNEELRKRMGKNGKGKLSTMFSVEDITKKYVDIFKSVCS